MSAFMPEGGSSSPSITPESHALPAEDDIALMQKVFAAAAARPNAIPETFMSYLLDWLQTSNLNIPIGQVFGFSQFVAASANVFSPEATSSDSYADLATVGPTLTGLSDGQYIVISTAIVTITTAGTGGIITTSVNGDGGSDNRAGEVQLGSSNGTGQNISLIGVGLARLDQGNNNIVQTKYRRVNGGGGGSCTFNVRNLIALKYANL